ncbi:hypothetical protein TPA0906_66150 [Streptomyces olivaceus]|uniref:hypothetical protein n=1 Tax=Streptomyces olivaceus TaxID=47716 RepID=UPI0022EFB32A|nr:hypothetical protein [Streptomyces olivaceus]GHJ04750.1 hypothetical protein TPA0906_66150 [Streptomyces olivaceus]
MTDQTQIREQVLHALDFAYCQTLGYGTPEELLAAYDASRTTTDPTVLRERIAALFRHKPDEERLGDATPGEIADAVLAALREAVAAALVTTRRTDYEGAADHRSHRYDARCALCAGDVDALADAVTAAVLPATTRHDTDTSAELASLAVNAGRALQDEKRHYEIACRENTRLRAMVDEYGDGAGALTRKLKRVRDLHRETCPLVKGEVPSGFKCGMCELLDAPAAPLRRMADETAATETQEVEDPARIDRLRPEVFEHASVEAIDAHIQRAQRQQRNWGNRGRTLATLRQNRVEQKERGEWPAGARQDGASS